MRIDIMQKGKSLRRIAHDGQVYVMAPKKGSYTLRVYNASNDQRLAVVTVDGVNVITGEDGDFDGQGYVLSPWQTMEIPGWRRSDDTVAAFTFKPEAKSYANKTGRGTSNVGVIGLASFDKKPLPVYYPMTCRCMKPCGCHSGSHVFGSTFTTTTVSSTTDSLESTAMCLETTTNSAVIPKGTQSRKTGILRRSRSRGVKAADSVPQDVGTGYGQVVDFQTTSVPFDRTDTPAEVVCLRYATRSRLETWGIPVDDMISPPTPEAFPLSRGPSVPAPPGWKG